MHKHTINQLLYGRNNQTAGVETNNRVYECNSRSQMEARYALLVTVCFRKQSVVVQLKFTGCCAIVSSDPFATAITSQTDKFQLIGA